MSPKFELSRREFISAIGGAGLYVVFNRLALASPTEAPLGWGSTPGKARYRIEGVPKVTGQKIYARDFRARDMTGWPPGERVAMILRTTRVDHLFDRIDLSMLPTPLQPLHVVTQADLTNDHITVPSSATPPAAWPTGLLVAAGARPIYYGQPVALLIFSDFETWRQAKRLLQFNPDVVRYGVQVAIPAVKAPYPPATYLTYFADAQGPQFSQVKNGYSNPYAENPTPVDLQAREVRERIASTFGQPGVRSFEGEFATQVMDPMFMEPEAGLAWFDSQHQSLQLVLGTQATNGDLSAALKLFSDPVCPIKVSTVELNSCYPGGGFGGRDVSNFPPLLALAAAYTDAPVRIAQDRYEQFQGGLKQLDSTIRQRIAVRPDGRIVALDSRQSLRAGGNNNLSQYVAALAGYCGAGGYQVDQASVDAVAVPTAGVVAGSMRGFGGPQACFAVECLIDEAAQALKLDPIVLRERNVLHRGDRTVTGAPLAQEMKLGEICRLARRHALWQERRRDKAQRKAAGLLYGVGFALANQAFGTGTDGVMAEVAIAADGRLAVRSNCVDMGNGSATTLALCTAAHAGANASTVNMGEAAYFLVPMGFDVTLPPTPKQWQNPRWTAAFSMSSSACLTGFHQAHVAEQAARVLFETGLLPAAARLWRVDIQALRGKTQWRNQRLYAPDLAPLPLASIAAQVYASGLPAAAMVHAVYQARWVSADYTVDGVPDNAGDEGAAWHATLPLDGVSTRLAERPWWRRHERANTQPPPPDAGLYGRSLYAPSGVLAAVQVEPRSGRIQVVAAQSFLDAGRVLQPDLVEGMSQGGLAMGIGNALFEDLPLLAEGGGNGRWNLDRYHLALAGDVPLKRLGLSVLPSTESAGKGIAEAVLCPVAPAIANAVADATGHRFRSLPITPAKIKEALE